jgi:hypothetical protein
MPKHKEPKPKTQSEKFIEAAKSLGCDENESAFDEIVKKVAKAPKLRKGGKTENNPRTRT